MCYFTVITFATIGYGDVLLFSILGKLTIIGFIVTMFVLFPKYTFKMIELMGK